MPHVANYGVYPFILLLIHFHREREILDKTPWLNFILSTSVAKEILQ